MGPAPNFRDAEKSPPKSPLKVIEILSLVCQSKGALLSWLGKAVPTKNISYPSFSPKTASIFLSSFFSFFFPPLAFSIRLEKSTFLLS
jgi:hypothetical protein